MALAEQEAARCECGACLPRRVRKIPPAAPATGRARRRTLNRREPAASRRPLRWYALREAAEMLGVSPEALRKQFERKARLTADGGTEAGVDGVRARKFANRWRVSFGPAWHG
jgi:hypothetical protein